MKNRFTFKLTTRQRLLNLQWVAKVLLISAVAGTLGYEQLEQLRHKEPTTIYYFTAAEDNFYENPANWSPEYPGTVIESDTRIVIQDMVYLTGFDLEVNGQLEVSMGATLYSHNNDIILGPTALLENQGEVVVKSIRNQGGVYNQMGAKIHVQYFVSSQKSMVQNLKSAQFIVIDSLTNHGNFLNYSYCATGELQNLSQFQQIRGSELRVDGKPVKLAALYNP